MRRWLAAAVVVVAGCSLISASRSSGLHPMRLSVTGSCPKALGNHDGVRNFGNGLNQRLVPGSPTALLICRYSPVGGLQTPREQHGVLYGSARLGASDAQLFARLLDAIPADHSEGSCGPDLSRYDVLAFSVGGRADIDVWSSSTGCWSFTNGARTTGAQSTALTAYMQRLQQAAPGETDVQASGEGQRGTLRGRLLAAAMSTTPLPGKVTLHPEEVPPILVDADGVFAVTLAPGTYTLTGRSPQYNDGRTDCRAEAPVHVVADQTVVANVYCVEK